MPPLIGVAVKVTKLPEHTEVAEADILTLTAWLAVTVMVILLDVAGLPVGQAIFEVSTQVTTSPLTSEDVVKEALFVPALLPFIFH